MKNSGKTLENLPKSLIYIAVRMLPMQINKTLTLFIYYSYLVLFLPYKSDPKSYLFLPNKYRQLRLGSGKNF